MKPGARGRGRQVASAQARDAVIRPACPQPEGSGTAARGRDLAEAKAVIHSPRQGRVPRNVESHPSRGSVRINVLDGRDPHQVLRVPAPIGGVNRGLHQHRMGDIGLYNNLHVVQIPAGGRGVIAVVNIIDVQGRNCV